MFSVWFVVPGGDEDKSQDVINQLLQEALDSETQAGPENKHFMLSSRYTLDIIYFLKYHLLQNNRVLMFI